MITIKNCLKHTSKREQVIVQYSGPLCPFCEKNKAFKKYRKEAKRLIQDAGKYCGV